MSLTVKKTHKDETNVVEEVVISSTPEKIFADLSSAIHNGKRIVISSHSEERKSEFKKLLTIFLPWINYLDFDDTILPQSLSQKLRQTQNIDKHDISFDTEYFKLKYNKTKNHLLADNNILSAHLFGNLTYHQVSEIITSMERNLSTPTDPLYFATQTFSFQVEELQSIQNLIIECAENHTKAANKSFELKNLDTQYWNSTNTDKLLKQLSTISLEIKKLCDEFLNLTSIQKSKFISDELSVLDEINKCKEELEIAIAFARKIPQEKENKGMFKIFSPKRSNQKEFENYVTKIIEQITSFAELEYNSGNSNTDLSFLLKTHQILEEKIVRIKSDSQRKITDHFKSLNIFNSNNNLISIWTDSVKQIVDKINDSKIFCEKLRFQFHSVDIQYKSLKNISERIDLLKEEIVTHDTYFEFLELKSKLINRIGEGIEFMFSHDKNKWVSIFKLHYFKALLHKYKTLSPNEKKIKLSEMQMLHTKKEEIYSKEQKNTQDVRTNAALTLLKKRDKKNHKNLLSLAESQRIQIKEFFNKHADLCWSLFPLVFSKNFDEDMLKGKTDQILFLGDTKELDIPNHQYIETTDLKYFKDELNLDNNKLKLNEFSVTQKLNLARIIAPKLLRFNSDVRILQMKNANIICILPIEWVDKIKNQLSKFGIKEFKAASYDQKENSIIESLMYEGRPHHLLIQDHHINIGKENLNDQYKLLKQLQNIGIIINNFTSLDYNHEIRSYTNKLSQVGEVDCI